MSPIEGGSQFLNVGCISKNCANFWQSSIEDVAQRALDSVRPAPTKIAGSLQQQLKTVFRELWRSVLLKHNPCGRQHYIKGFREAGAQCGMHYRSNTATCLCSHVLEAISVPGKTEKRTVQNAEGDHLDRIARVRTSNLRILRAEISAQGSCTAEETMQLVFTAMCWKFQPLKWERELYCTVPNAEGDHHNSLASSSQDSKGTTFDYSMDQDILGKTSFDTTPAWEVA
ncbi:hypothetical protein Bbelb_223290 [Branchiostoma belcheri]|nr:hypothetical protein Bbelb_223290 [Branchiostoma belcheri]